MAHAFWKWPAMSRRRLISPDSVEAGFGWIRDEVFPDQARARNRGGLVAPEANSITGHGEANAAGPKRLPSFSMSVRGEGSREGKAPSPIRTNATRAAGVPRPVAEADGSRRWRSTFNRQPNASVICRTTMEVPGTADRRTV